MDPEGKLIDPNWYAGAYTLNATTGKPDPTNRMIFEQSCYSVTNTTNTNPNPPIYAYYYVPVVVSAGADQILGLDLQTMLPLPTATANDVADNIYGYQVKKE